MVVEPLLSPFIQRALLAGLSLAIVVPILGFFMVHRRFSLVGDTLAHTAFAGAALGILLNTFPLWPALGVTLISSLGVAKLRKVAKIASDAALAVFLTLGMASGMLILSLSRAAGPSLSSLLFGSILLISWLDVLVIGVVCLSSLSIIIILYRKLLLVTLDEELAEASGLSVSSINYILSALASVLVVASIRVVGVLLVSSLLVLPVLASVQLSGSFRGALLLSSLIASVAVVAGITLSFYLASPSGVSIVLVAQGILGLSLLARLLPQK